jgi:hypothetical protein
MKDKKEIVVVAGICEIGDCNCCEKAGRDPKIVGYPPYHTGEEENCTCYIIVENNEK